MSKAKEEKIARPGLYSPHEKVMEMSNCVCGTYVKFPINQNILTPAKKAIEIDLLIQVDDLLGVFSGVNYIPRFMTGDLELEISPNILQNMVFCPIPFDVFIQTESNGLSADSYKAFNEMDRTSTDFRFTQCGDYAKLGLGYLRSAESSDITTLNGLYATLNVSNLEVIEAKSYVHGFNIKDTCKQNILAQYKDKKLVIPSQWCEWYSLSQLNNTNNIKCNIQVPMFNATQLVFTFPNSSNQLTVSKNPHLEAVQCHVADKIIPDKFLNTLEPAFGEMILSELGMDTLFSASESLIEALSRNRGTYSTITLKQKDDGDFMI